MCSKNQLNMLTNDIVQENNAKWFVSDDSLEDREETENE